MAHAQRFFAAEIEVLSASPMPRPDLGVAEVRLRLSSARYPGSGTFRLEARPRTADDQFAAEAAEARGNATNMSLLAAQCPAVWSITPEPDVSGSAELQLSALLASVALGPVLPAAQSTRYGVRGAMERADAAAGNGSL